jgi:hypothetical protein
MPNIINLKFFSLLKMSLVWKFDKPFVFLLQVQQGFF